MDDKGIQALVQEIREWPLRLRTDAEGKRFYAYTEPMTDSEFASEYWIDKSFVNLLESLVKRCTRYT